MKPASDIEQQAATWLARRESENWSGEDQAMLDAWAAESAAHRIALLRLETVWRKADRLRSMREEIVGDESLHPVILGSGRIARWLPDWKMPAIAAVVALGVSLLALHWLHGRPDTYVTPVGGFQQLPLADGSWVELNTNTRLNVSFSDAERRVELARGEAFFSVEKDAQRPFVVQAGKYRVVAIGTAFSVKIVGGEVDVKVTEGRVRVDGSAAEAVTRPTFVSAGQALVAAPDLVVVRPADSAELMAALSWRERLLVFESRPLGEVAAEFNRYNHRRLVVDPSATSVVVDGTFRATNLDGFVRLMGQGFDVEGVPVGKDEIVLRRR